MSTLDAHVLTITIREVCSINVSHGAKTLHINKAIKLYETNAIKLHINKAIKLLRNESNKATHIKAIKLLELRI